MRVGVAVVALSQLAGCARHNAGWSAPDDLPRGPATSRIYPIASQELFDQVERAVRSPGVGVRVASTDRGLIVTEPNQYLGSRFNLRRRLEQTTYTIAVHTDWDVAGGAASFVTVDQRTQVRWNDREPWQGPVVDSVDDLRDRERRATHLKETIESELDKSVQAKSS
jgi:hypothetical protein